MKTKLLLSFSILAFTFSIATAQIQKGFNYQAVARDASGHSIVNTAMPVRLSILADSLGSTIVWQELHSNVTTNSFGLINVVLGKGSRVTGTALTFSAIDWSVGPKFIKTEINYGGWLNMGTTRLWSVPYALLADKANGVNAGTKLSVVSNNDGALDEALFEVKRKDGQTVFAVYPEAVNIYVPRSGKGVKGGFAVGGFDGTKLAPQDYFRVTPDSVRIYIDPTPDAKSTKGGFAVGGYDATKGISNMYFNLTGASNVNTVKGSPQILWYPNKNAFLAGNVHIGAMDSVGRYSTALGYRSIAMGDYSQAFGYMAKAFGDYSTSIGRNSVAGVRDKTGSIAGSAFALGNSTRATGEDSYAFGSGAVAEGEKSFALGSVALDESGNPLKTEPTRASGPYSTAIGMGAQATQKGAMALGVRASSSGYYSNSFGYLSVSSGYYSTAIGYHAAATNYYAGSYGYYSKADGQGSVALGNKSWAISDYSVAIGDSAKTTAAYAGAFGRMAKAKGSSSVAVGYNAVTYGTDAGAFGKNSLAKGVSSVAIGYNAQTSATGIGSGAFGYSSVANGQYSVAVGPIATTGASANYAGSFGYSAAANGSNSVAVGYGATTGTSATDASAFGRSANASGLSSMALGVNASSVGTNSIAIGNAAVANAASSTSLGSNTTTSVDALYSTALGFGSSTAGQYATALGYNAQANGAKSISIGAYYDYTYYRLIYNPITHRFTMTPVHVTKTNIANNDYSIAIGNGNTSSLGGLTLGSNNTASKIGAVAIGHTNYADSAYSFAAGANNYARGYNAFALGESIIAEASNSFVIGYNNITSSSYDRDEWIATDPLFVIGNGGSGSQSNAMTVLKNGNTTISGNLTVTGTITGYSGGDGLGTHSATQNLKMNGWYISNDGGNEGLWVSTTGAVGINNTAPSYTLDVSGSMRSTGSMVAGSNLYTFGNLFAYSNLYTSYINPDNNANLTVDAGTLHVDGTNNRVGVNNATPAYGLDVNGTMNVTSSGRFGGDVTLSSASPAFYFTDTDLDHDDFKFEANNDGLVVSTQGKTPVVSLIMTSTGGVAMPTLRIASGIALNISGTTGEITKASSSMRYKNTINSLDDISWLYNLRPVSFIYNQDPLKTLQYGLIAEEVEKVNNSLVVYDNEGKPDGIIYDNLISTLLKAAQDQKKTIESLQADNNALKQRLEKLELIVNSLTQIQK